jgi:hypothetical protein
VTKVLVVDDQTAVRDLMVVSLSQEGVTVTAVADGVEALEPHPQGAGADGRQSNARRQDPAGRPEDAVQQAPRMGPVPRALERGGARAVPRPFEPLGKRGRDRLDDNVEVTVGRRRHGGSVSRRRRIQPAGRASPLWSTRLRLAVRARGPAPAGLPSGTSLPNGAIVLPGHLDRPDRGNRDPWQVIVEDLGTLARASAGWARRVMPAAPAGGRVIGSGSAGSEAGSGRRQHDTAHAGSQAG